MSDIVRGLEAAREALNVWTVCHAPEFCSQKDVDWVNEKLAYGTLMYIDDVQALLDAAVRAASGIETEGHDPEEGHGAEHESPTAEGGDAQGTSA